MPSVREPCPFCSLLPYTPRKVHMARVTIVTDTGFTFHRCVPCVLWALFNQGRVVTALLTSTRDTR